MSTIGVRRRFLHRLARELGTQRIERVRHAGSHSMIALGNRALILIRASVTLCREGRVWTSLRRTDVARLQEHRCGLVTLLAPALREPVTVPIDILVANTLPETDPIHVHLRVGARGQVVHVESGSNLAPYLGWAPLQRFRRTGPQAYRLPGHSHAQWQTIAAVVGRRTGHDVFVPPANRAELDPRLARGAGLLPACTELPSDVGGISTLRFADVVWSRPGARSPSLIWEVEQEGDIREALSRSCHTLEELRELGVDPLPEFVIAAETGRRGEFEGKLRKPLYLRTGFVDRCRFVSYASLWEAYRWLRSPAG